MIELYAITDHPGPALPAIAPLRVVAHERLGIVCACISEPAKVSADELWQHERIVEALMEDRDLLPVRYGTRLEDEQAVTRALEERQPELARALDRVRGAVELSVRALRTGEDEGDETASGSAYLRARARSAAAAGALHEPLSALARMSVRRPASAPAEALRAAYLVDRGEVERFAGLVRDLDEANPDLHVLCTGPWPPYSFADR